MKRIILATIEVVIILWGFSKYYEITPTVILLSIMIGIITIVYDILNEVRDLLNAQHDAIFGALVIAQYDKKAEKILQATKEFPHSDEESNESVKSDSSKEVK